MNKETIFTIILLLVMFGAGVWFENVRAKNADTPEAYYAMCLKYVERTEGAVSNNDARACGGAAYFLYQEGQSK